MQERTITLLPGSGNVLAVPGLGRFKAGEPRAVRISPKLEKQLKRTPLLWKVGLAQGNAVLLADGKTGMITKGKPGKWLVQVPGEELERDLEESELRPGSAEKLLAAAEASYAEDSTTEFAAGDLVQWTSAGAAQWLKRKRIERVEDGFAFFSGSETGIPFSELTKE